MPEAAPSRPPCPRPRQAARRGGAGVRHRVRALVLGHVLPRDDLRRLHGRGRREGARRGGVHVLLRVLAHRARRRGPVDRQRLPGGPPRPRRASSGWGSGPLPAAFFKSRVGIDVATTLRAAAAISNLITKGARRGSPPTAGSTRAPARTARPPLRAAAPSSQTKPLVLRGGVLSYIGPDFCPSAPSRNTGGDSVEESAVAPGADGPQLPGRYGDPCNSDARSSGQVESTAPVWCVTFDDDEAKCNNAYAQPTPPASRTGSASTTPPGGGSTPSATSMAATPQRPPLRK